MKPSWLLRMVAAAAAVFSLSLSAPAIEPAVAPPPADVELDPQGFLHGLLVDINGVPVTGMPVVVSQGDRVVAQVPTDLLGRFAVGPIRGGTYQLAAGDQMKGVRAWTARTAPPSARPMTLLVVGSQTVRGQLPASRLFSSDRVVVAGMVGAAIALPIVINNSDSSPPKTP